MFQRIKIIVKKEFKQIRRDRRSLGILIFLPVFMLIMFGYAVNFDVRDIRIAVLDEDGSHQSREFIEKFTQSGYFIIESYPGSAGEIDRLLDREKVRAVIIIPPDYSENLIRGSEAPVQILIDGSNASAAATVAGYVNMLIQRYSIDILGSRLEREGAGIRIEAVEFHPRVWYNPELRSPVFLIPGLIVFILMVTAVVSTSLSIVREKERGTMEQLSVSPVRPVELILGKTLPYMFTSLVTTLLILAGGYLLFGVGIAGSIIMLFLLVVIFLVVALGWGLIISATSSTQQVAFLKTLTTTLLPTFILSGFVFPIHNMPVPIQAVTYIVPARYFIQGLRGIMIKGVGVGMYWEQLAALLVFAVVLTTVSTLYMKKRGYTG